MTYKLTTVVFKNGRKQYHAYKKCWFGWTSINWQGKIFQGFTSDYDAREDALDAIDKNFQGNNERQETIVQIIVK